MIHSKGKSLLWLGVLVLLLAPLALQATTAVADEWVIEVLDEDAGSQAPSLVLDERGYPHISSFHRGYQDLRYVYRDDGGWHIEIVDSEWHEGGVGPSLALDGDGYPHISYYNGGEDYHQHHGDLKYACQDDSGWHIEIVDSEGWVGMSNSLALDEDGYPHISYLYCGTRRTPCNVADLRYAYQGATGWYTETVDSEGSVGYYTSLALDGSGYPHISYWDSTNDDLKYAYQDISGWHIQTVDDGYHTGEYTSLALDENGYPHISYCQDYGALGYAYQDNYGWHIETVESGEEVFVWGISLALDEGGYPHISYFDFDLQDVKYAYKDDFGWHTEIVDNKLYSLMSTSLTLDANGYPHISYVGWGGVLHHAYPAAAQPTPTPTSTPTATHTPTMTPTSTSTPKVTPTPTLTLTATPTSTPTPTPTSIWKLYLPLILKKTP